MGHRRMVFGGISMRELVEPEVQKFIDHMVSLSPAQRTITLSHILSEYYKCVNEGSAIDHHLLGCKALAGKQVVKSERVSQALKPESKKERKEGKGGKERSDEHLDNGVLTQTANPEKDVPREKSKKPEQESGFAVNPSLAHLIG